MPKRPKILFVATVSGHITAFHLPYLQWFQQRGFETHVVTGDKADLPYVDKHYVIPMTRSPFSLANIKAVVKLHRLMRKKKYSIVHCHTPVGGVVTRLGAIGAIGEGKLFYTAHGFHFFRGASLLNWLVFFPIEYMLSFFTDFLLTINHEDFSTAKKKRLAAKSIKYVNGVGVDLGKFSIYSQDQKKDQRGKYGFGTDEILLISVAEMNENKNQALLLRAFAQLVTSRPKEKYRLLLVGDGYLRLQNEKLADELGIAQMVTFMGYRRDVDQLLPLCDLALSASHREGLPVNVIESLACGVPVVASKIRGHVDLITPGKNGMLIELDANAPQAFAKAIMVMLNKKRDGLQQICRDSVAPYEQQRVLQQVTKLYERALRDTHSITHQEKPL